MMTRRRDVERYIRGGTVTPVWFPDGRHFAYLSTASGTRKLWRVDVSNGSAAPLLDPARLAEALKGEGVAVEPGAIPFADFRLADGGRAIEFEIDRQAYRVAIADYRATRLPPSDARVPPRFQPGDPGGLVPNELISPDRQQTAYIDAFNIRLSSNLGGAGKADLTWPVTTDGVEGNAWSFGDGARWSADGAYIAAIKTDMTGVWRMPIPHWMTPDEHVEYLPYPHAGGQLPHQRLYAIDVRSKRATPIDTRGEADAKIMILGWSASTSRLVFLRVDRLNKVFEVLDADPVTGQSRVLARETSPTFAVGLEFVTGGWERFFTPLRDGRFLLLSERDGWKHVYLYPANGGRPRQLTRGAWPVDRVVGVDEARGVVFFAARSDPARPYDTHVHRVGLDGRGMRRLTSAAGQHNPSFSPDYEYFIDNHEHLNRAPSAEIRRSDGQLVSVIERADVTALAATKLLPPEPFVVKADDGVTDLHGVMFKPYDFDPTRRYPVLEIIYGGPQLTVVPQRYFARGFGWAQRESLAELGYIVVVLDGRGTPKRSKAFQDVVYGRFGQTEIPDHAAALRQLGERHPFMDMNRVAIIGHSWGGYFATRALLTAPDLYKVGIASSMISEIDTPHPDPIEPYLGGRPQDVPELYAKSSNLSLAHRLQGNLLFIMGTSDYNLSFSQTVRMADALIRAGKPYDLVLLPEQTHIFRGLYVDYALAASARYLAEHLGSPADRASLGAR